MKNQDIQPINQVKNKLWRFSYRIKDCSMFKDVKFDLLVNDKFRVKVGTVKPTRIPKVYDVFAYVQDDIILFLTKPAGGLMENKSPYDVFGRN